MIAHIVLFRPRTSLTDHERRVLVDALTHAMKNIPSVRRAHIGRRTILGRQYDSMNAQQFPFAAILEFESEADLRTYLDHPAHEKLGEQFYFTSDGALAFDYEMLEPERASDLLS